MSKSYRVKEAEDLQKKIAATMANHIMQLIAKEVQQLQTYWYKNVNRFFSRRAYGKAYFGKVSPPRPKQRGRVRTPYIANTRQHTGQLRRALTLSQVNIYGASMYVGRVYAKTDNRDYVDILMRGSAGKPGAYIPSFDLRVKHGWWGGINRVYWLTWQWNFMAQIRKSEARINQQIERYIEKMQILTPKELRAARNMRHNKEFVDNISTDERNFSIEFKKKKYDDAHIKNEPYKKESTWEGMKSNYYAKTLAANPLTAAMPEPTTINRIIKKEKRLGGRGH